VSSFESSRVEYRASSFESLVSDLLPRLSVALLQVSRAVDIQETGSTNRLLLFDRVRTFVLQID